MEGCSKVRFESVEDVREFVFAAEKCDFDVDIFYNKYMIDAKCILGVLSMDLSKSLNVRCHGNSPEFNRTLRKFAIV